MRDASDSLAPTVRMPKRVFVCLSLLGAVWALRLWLTISQIITLDAPQRVIAIVFGTLVLGVTGVLVYLIARGNTLGRNFYLGLLVISLVSLVTPPMRGPPPRMPATLFDELVFAAQLSALLLLFTPAARHWFRQVEASRVASNNRWRGP